MAIETTLIPTDATHEDAVLSELMAMINGDEVVEPTAPVAEPSDATVAEVDAAITAAEPLSFADAVGATIEPTPAPVTDDDIADALVAAESVEAMIAAATTEVADGSVTEATDEPAPEATDEVTPVEAAPEKVRTPRKHYTNKAERIKDRLGDSLGEYTVLTLDDAAAAMDEESLKAKMDETMTLVAGMSKKKQNRAGFLLEFVAGKKATLNNVMKLALTQLATDGSISMGKDGNYLKTLLAVPYSPAAARAMGGNTVAVLEDLKLITLSAKGVYVANPDSLLLAKVNEMLGLATPSAD